MTKVQIRFELSRPLDDKDLNSISRVHSVYGIFAARVLPSGNELLVEYDASRLSPDEVRGVLEQQGVPIT